MSSGSGSDGAKPGEHGSGGPNGYDMEPWRNPQQQQPPPPVYQPPGSVGPSMGSQQNAREYV